LQVRRLRPQASVGPNTGSGSSKHAPAHFRTGDDPVYIDTSQIVPLLVYPAGGMALSVKAGYILTTTGLKKVPAATLNMTSQRPSGTQARWVLIQVSDAAQIGIKPGDPAATYTDLNTESVPAADTGCRRLAAVRLYGGQTAIKQDNSQTDVIDLRFVDASAGAVISEGSAGHVLVHNGAQILYPPTTAGLLSAAAAAVSGDRLIIAPGTYATDLDLPAGTKAECTTQGAATIAGTVTLGEACELEAVAVVVSTSGATPAVAVQGPASGTAILFDCVLRAAQTGTADATVVSVNGGAVGVRDCYTRASAADPGATARIMRSAGAVDDCVFEYCVFAAAVDLNTAPPANWGVAAGLTPQVGDCLWPTGWTPAGIDYIPGDRAVVTHSHTSLVVTDDSAGATVLRLGHGSTGAPSDGFRGALTLELDDSTAEAQEAGQIEWRWVEAAHASRSSAMVFTVTGTGGTPSDILSLDQNGATLAGNLDLTSGHALSVNGVQIVSGQQAAIADAKVDYVAGDLDIEAELITALNTTNGKINAILAALRSHGLIAS
jgi:hypothetical protein